MSSDHRHDHVDLGPPRVEEVADRVFAYVQPDGSWWINNTGFLVADDGVTAIDTCSTERRTRTFLDAVRDVSEAPIRLVVNTHHHGDHTHGNYLTHPAAIVAHERCRELILETGILHVPGVWDDVDWGDLEVAPPIVTFDDTLTVYSGDTRVELHYIGTPAHTTNDVVTWLPEQRVLYAGDLVFNGGTPFVLMGSLAGALESVQRLRSFDAEVVVPGHGEVCDLSALDRIEAYYRFVDQLAEEAERAEVAPLEAAREADLGEFAELTDTERLAGNLHRALAERRGAERGAPIDLITAIGDMIQFNGGRPMRCLA
jgi:cyclase